MLSWNFVFEKFPEISHIIFPLPKSISKVSFGDIKSGIFLSKKRNYNRFSSHSALHVIIFQLQESFIWQLFLVFVCWWNTRKGTFYNKNLDKEQKLQSPFLNLRPFLRLLFARNFALAEYFHLSFQHLCRQFFCLNSPLNLASRFLFLFFVFLLSFVPAFSSIFQLCTMLFLQFWLLLQLPSKFLLEEGLFRARSCLQEWIRWGSQRRKLGSSPGISRTENMKC